MKVYFEKLKMQQCEREKVFLKVMKRLYEMKNKSIIKKRKIAKMNEKNDENR